MKKIKILAMMILCLSLFNACSSKKEIIFKDRLVCSEQLIIEKPKADLRVKKADFKVAKAFKEALDSSFSFYENQVNQNNKLCEEIKNDNIK